jgi:RNA polymerase primary sigma factor
MRTKATQLYAWQDEALDAWRTNGRRGIVQAVTGAGKTMLGLVAAHEALEAEGRVVVLVPTIELQRQWTRRIKEYLPDARVGRIGGGEQADFVFSHVVVGVVNSMRKTSLRPPTGSLLIGDECHRYGSEFNRLALDKMFDRRLGLSATYERDDDGHLDHLLPYFGEPCYELGYKRALRDDVVAHFKVALLGVRFTPGEEAMYEEADETARSALAWLKDYLGFSEPFGELMKEIGRLAKGSAHRDARSQARRYLKAFSDRQQVLANTESKFSVLDALAPAVAASSRSLIFTMRKLAAERAANILRAAPLENGQSIEAYAFHSGLDNNDRADLMLQFQRGDTKALVAPRVLDEGVDVPDADLAVILSTSRSRRQMVQRMGRILRPKSDGRLARFAIVFVENTIEDPRSGAHEAFLNEVEPLADERMISWSGSDRGPAVAFLATPHAGPNRQVESLLERGPAAEDFRPLAPARKHVAATASTGFVSPAERARVAKTLQHDPLDRRLPAPTHSNDRVFAASEDYATETKSRGAPFHAVQYCPALKATGTSTPITLHHAKVRRMVPCPICIAT